MGLITPKRVAPVLVEPHFQLNSPNQTFVLEYLIYNIVAGISITSKILCYLDYKIFIFSLNRFRHSQYRILYARLVELADTLVLGTSAVRFVGSSPTSCTMCFGTPTTQLSVQCTQWTPSNRLNDGE